MESGAAAVSLDDVMMTLPGPGATVGSITAGPGAMESSMVEIGTGVSDGPGALVGPSDGAGAFVDAGAVVGAMEGAETGPSERNENNRGWVWCMHSSLSLFVNVSNGFGCYPGSVF